MLTPLNKKKLILSHFSTVIKLSNDRDSGRRPPFPPLPNPIWGKAADRSWEYISDKVRLQKLPFLASNLKYF